jgi:hypothetical protein
MPVCVSGGALPKVCPVPSLRNRLHIPTQVDWSFQENLFAKLTSASLLLRKSLYLIENIVGAYSHVRPGMAATLGQARGPALTFSSSCWTSRAGMGSFRRVEG